MASWTAAGPFVVLCSQAGGAGAGAEDLLRIRNQRGPTSFFLAPRAVARPAGGHVGATGGALVTQQGRPADGERPGGDEGALGVSSGIGRARVSRLVGLRAGACARPFPCCRQRARTNGDSVWARAQAALRLRCAHTLWLCARRALRRVLGWAEASGQRPVPHRTGGANCALASSLWGPCLCLGHGRTPEACRCAWRPPT